MENERLEIPKLYLEKVSLPTKICLKLTSRLKPAGLSRVFTATKYMALIIKNTGLQFLRTSVPRFNYGAGRIRQSRSFLVGDNRGFI